MRPTQERKSGANVGRPTNDAEAPRVPERPRPMKKSLVTFAAAALLCSSAALAQSVGEKTGVNSTLDITPTTQDFIKEAAMSDMLEIESSKIAQQKGNADEKKFADQMITDHTKTSSELKGLVSGGDVKAVLP